MLVLLTISGLFIACQKEEPALDKNSNTASDLQLKNVNGFILGIILEIDAKIIILMVLRMVQMEKKMYRVIIGENPEKTN